MHDQEANRLVYTHAICIPFERPKRWEPWEDNRIPTVRFLEFFCMTQANFFWLLDQLRNKLQQDPVGQGNPLTVKAQVAIGLYRLAHGASYVTIGHIFNIGKETADKATGRFVNAVLKTLRLQTVW
jgi:hypothetical protein